MQGDAIEMYAIEPDGKPDANYIIIGESPGNTDIQENKLFAGWAGELLFDDILARAGIMRKSCLVTNVYWEKPPANKMEAIR